MEEEDQNAKSEQNSALDWADLNKQLDERLEQCLNKKQKSQNSEIPFLFGGKFYQNLFVEQDKGLNQNICNKKKKIFKLKRIPQVQGLKLLNFKNMKKQFQQNPKDQKIIEDYQNEFEVQLNSNPHKTKFLKAQDNLLKKQNIPQERKKDDQINQFIYQTPVRRCNVYSQSLVILFQRELKI